MSKRRFLLRTIAAVLALILCMSTAVFAEENDQGQNSQETLSGAHVDQKTGKMSYFENGEVKTDFKGVERCDDDGIWYYFEEGENVPTFTGFAENRNGWWYINKGKVDFTKNDVMKGVAKGKDAWWNVRKGKITGGPTVAKNRNGWWYIDEEGKVNFKYNGLAKNKNGWWYCKRGKVNFKYNGLAKNKNGTWRVAKGKVTFGFTGIAKYGKKAYYIKKGKVQSNYSGRIKFKGATYQVKKGIAKESVSAAMVTKAQGYSSSTGWLVLVDRKHHKLAAFSGSRGNWTLRRSYSIADGKSTPTGQFTMGTRFSYYDSAAGNRCWYCITIKGYYLFHSVLCDPRSSTPKVKNGTVGKTISKGCIRQPVKDAKWLYDTCPRGTKIVIY